MIKYIPNMTSVVFEEIPDKVSVAINITNCQNNCIGCHSSFLKKNIGEELNEKAIDKIIEDNYGINCVIFMGEGNDLDALKSLAFYVKEKYNLSIAIYSGREKVEDDFYELFDYVKVGPYKEEFGPLNKKTTNQRLYYHREDITYKFWRNKL